MPRVLEDAHRRALEKYPLDSPEYEALPAAGRLRVFIQHTVFKLFDDDISAHRFKLMAWEMIEPTAALDSLVAKIIRPLEQRLTAIVRELLGPGATAEQVRCCGTEYHRPVPASPARPACYPAAFP